MKAYKGVFKKKNGMIREMTFARFSDLDDDKSGYVASKILGKSSSRQVPDGSELVWDIDEHNFRYFNWNTALEQPIEIDVDDDEFYNEA